MNNLHDMDPLECLARLNPHSMSLEFTGSARAHASESRSGHSSSTVRMCGTERATMLRGLHSGPKLVAYYFTTYDLGALVQLENFLYEEVRSIASVNEWKCRGEGFRLRRVGILALLEKYFNVCTVCKGTTRKKDGKQCNSCINGHTYRTQRECGSILGIDHKSYAHTWQRRVGEIIEVLDLWEDIARHRVLANLRR